MESQNTSSGPNSLISAPVLGDMPGRDFGFGIYYTWSYELARLYTSTDGVICVYDFSDGPGDLSVTRLEGEEWVETVKWYLMRWNDSLGEVVKNKEIAEDFAIGATTNTVQRVSVVMNGEVPVATAATQVCAKSQRAADYMAARLVAVICMS